ncbi:hypothetical protein, partial [Ruminococcus sp.]|uniref:hypothetical protein n=1 Tax=Ruminococcus sp. TaxID=41978 RepID=UPI003991719B
FKNASKKITEAHFFVNLGFLICCFLQHLSSDCINGKYLWACPHSQPLKRSTKLLQLLDKTVF